MSAADIPPELFSNIIGYVSTDEHGGRSKLHDPDMRSCSLVCVYWTEKIRRILFSGRVLEINLAKNAAALRETVMGHVSERFEPVIELVDKVEVRLTLEGAPRSWLHILGSLVPRVPLAKFSELIVHGPTPATFANRQLRRVALHTGASPGLFRSISRRSGRRICLSCISPLYATFYLSATSCTRKRCYSNFSPGMRKTCELQAI